LSKWQQIRTYEDKLLKRVRDAQRAEFPQVQAHKSFISKEIRTTHEKQMWTEIHGSFSFPRPQPAIEGAFAGRECHFAVENPLGGQKLVAEMADFGGRATQHR